MNVVVDASIAVEYLLRTALGEHASGTLESAVLFAPELLDAEVLAVVRRELLRGRLTVNRAQQALDDLVAWDVQRIAHRELVALAWSHRANVSAYDAFYVAAAERYDAVVMTADGPLSRVRALGIVIQNLR